MDVAQDQGSSIYYSISERDLSDGKFKLIKQVIAFDYQFSDEFGNVYQQNVIATLASKEFKHSIPILIKNNFLRNNELNKS